jgi:small GTP-binding protein
MEDADEPIDESKVSLGVFSRPGVSTTALILRFIRGEYVEEYIPSLADDFSKDVTIEGKTIHLELVETAGQSDFSEMRESFYRAVQGFVFVYSVTDRDSLNGIQEIYKDILATLQKTEIPCVIVGNRRDLTDEVLVSTEEGQEFSEKCGAKLFETCLRTGESVDAAFEEGIRAVQRTVFKQRTKKRNCAVF